MVPEETTGAGSMGDRPDELGRRLDRIERELIRENRWWRGGLIAALVLVALSIFAAAHHRYRRPGPGMGPMMMGGPMGPMMGGPMGGPMGMQMWRGAPNMWGMTPGYGPYPPPPRDGGCGCGEYHGHGDGYGRRGGDGPWGTPEGPPPPPKG